MLVYVRAQLGPASIQIAADVGGSLCRRNTDDLVLGRRLRVVDDEEVDTILRRLNLEPELFLQGRKKSRTVRVHRRQRGCTCWRCWQWSVRRPVEVDIKVTRKSGSVFNWTVVVHPATHQTCQCLYGHRSSSCLAGNIPESLTGLCDKPARRR